MSHALNALDHALRGDPSGLSFLEQTASIYVLDVATTPGQPKTYGWWNFLNDALNEVERYEENGNTNSLDAHVRLLATVTRRMARRPPASDRRLIGTCLANASMTHMALLANSETSRSLLQNNEQLRERDMGRIAAIVFDYSFHRKRTAQMRRSAFSDPLAMEQFCGVIAANAVSTGQNAVRHLVCNWIVTSCDSLPSFSVAAILNHVAVEAMGKGCPLGVQAVVKECVGSVFVTALGPLLVEALRESEEGLDEGDVSMGDSGSNRNNRTAAITLKALDSWCRATEIGAVQLRNTFASSKINILEAIADALYSNSEQVIDAVSDLIESLLRIDSFGNSVSSGLSIVRAVMSNASSTNNLLLAQQVAGENVYARMSILAELISAVGLQRLRFSERQAKGDIAVCRCLTRTAARVLMESKDFMTSGNLQVSLDGLFDLLFKAISHPSTDISGLALEAFSRMAGLNSELSTRLLPYLQGKAIIPFQLRNDQEGYEEFADFRDNFLKAALVACYAGCGAFYLQSCGVAIDEFCQATGSPHLPHQLEAALFCLVAVSEKAKKANDKQTLEQQLVRIVSALKRNSFTTTSNPFVMARMCGLIRGYALVLSRCQDTTFEAASELVLTSFNMSTTAYNESTSMPASECLSTLSEATNALQKLLCSAPSRFIAPRAMSALESAWNMPYNGKRLAIKDREILCSGFCVVIASLPTDQHASSIHKLTQPILSCLHVAVKEAETNLSQRSSIIQRLANEIRLLAAVVKHFIRTDAPSRFDLLSELLHKAWQVIAFIGTTYSSEEVVADAMWLLLKDSLFIYRSANDSPLLQEICALAKSVATKNPSTLPAFLSFVQNVTELHGHKAEIKPNLDSESIAIGAIVKELMVTSYENVMSFSTHQKQQPLSTPDDKSDIMSSMFKTLSACANKCPILLLTVARDGQTAGELVLSSVQASPGTLKAAEFEVSLSTINFLRVLISKLSSLPLEQLNMVERNIVSSIIDSIKQIVRTDVMSATVVSICGLSPQTVVSPVADLMQSILQFSQWEEVEPSITSALTPYQFKLGDDCKLVVLDVFKRCTGGSYPSPNFEDLVSDVWNMHQTDDTESIAGGQIVNDFITKHRSNR